MKRRFALTVSIISVFLIFNPIQVLSQDDFIRKNTKGALEIERAQAALTSGLVMTGNVWTSSGESKKGSEDSAPLLVLE